MVVLGVTVLMERLRGVTYALYWSLCFIVTVAALVIACCDLVMVRRAGRRVRRSLFEEQFMSEEFLRRMRRDRKKP